MNPLHYSQHEGISCDHCMKSNFRGKRYKCLVCPDYDLCASCYESGTVPAGKRHTSKHAVQCILTRNDYEIYFGGETTPIEQIQSFTCPICGKMGFTESLLYDHAVQEHADTFTEVSCPICCSMQNVEPGLTIEDFTSHLSIEHRSGRGYDTPQASLRGRRMPHTNRGVNQARNRRQITPTTVTMLSNINPLLGSLPHDQAVGGLSGAAASQIRDLDPITELLSQLRRSQNASQSALSANSFSSASANPLHLHLDHRNFRGNALRQVFDRPSANDIVVRRHNQAALSQQANQSSLAAAHAGSLSYLLMDSSANQLTGGQPVPNSNSLTNQVGQPQSNQFQFLLSTCKEKPKISKELEDAQRVDKSLFIQELLISSIENFFRHDLKFERSGEQRISLDHSGLDELRQEARPDGAESKPGCRVEQGAQEQQINGETASPNNHLASGGGLTSECTNESPNESKNECTNESTKTTVGQSQRTSSESNQSNHHETSNNQELNHQIAKGEHTGNANSETAANNSEPVASNSVENNASNSTPSNSASNDLSNNNLSGTPSGPPSGIASDPVARIKQPTAEPRNDQQPAK